MAQTPNQDPFVLTRVSVSDLPEMLALQYDCFPPFIRQIFMGCNTEVDIPKIQEVYAEQIRTDPNDIWLKVVDRESAKIIAASNWKVYVNGITNGGVGDRPPPWLEREQFELSERYCKEVKEYRAKAFSGPFIHLHICFTHPEYRRRGAGGLMLQWGCDVADKLGLPGWIEASKEGNFLYKAFGFYDYETIESDLDVTNMKRDAKVELAVGGKSK
ncbi:uncharacterized protein LTR77_004444 [Saxophila tyrrhenica]|uniref:N-acetyltransferase domain-containing protein n=1 Tax=Saxophila tyrrhenica TaxID=1690608 RepID=A0AAV9PDG8_9PEZI|nr:hypothetical protein LTR77_004444 [Saxophila tyrrhenica]